ncbi:Ig-like domain-containing protein [Flavobacterium sp. ARAG 55.4]|uniref:rhamnogalacturonan lyase family protein n=1 Tax=Flavobacterium sp. ARAG 55.4 TaxID=3451357 RepID=UPI003F44F5A5
MNRKLLKNNLLWGIVIVFFLGTFNDAIAQNYSWVGAASSDFSTFENWNPVPSAFTASDVFTITATANNDSQITNSAAINCRQITIGKGVTFNATQNITTPSAATTSVNGTLNINTATVNSAKFYVGNSSASPGIVNVNAGANLIGNNVWRLGLASSGTININGGTLTLGSAGSLTLGYSSNSTGVININSGTLNVNYTSFSSLSINTTGSVTIDAGSMRIPGDQTMAVQALVDANKIKASGMALAAGKPISGKYDSETNTTTVIAGTFINNPPIAVADAFTVALNGMATSLDNGQTSVLANDNDIENNVLSAVLVNSPVNGTLILNSDGTFSYVHNGSDTITDSFSYKTNDGTSDSNIVNVTITISHIPSPNGLSYSTPNIFTKGIFKALNPTVSGGAVASYSVSPNLPAGISLNTKTGIISGTSRSVSAENEYTITATNIAGSTTAKIAIAVNDYPGGSMPRPMEFLDRGLVALGIKNGVFLSWRMVGSDNPDVGFNLYKNGAKLNTTPITSSTNYVDPSGLVSDVYKVEAISSSGNQTSPEVTVWPYAPSIEPGKPNVARLEIPIPAAPGPDYFAGDMSVGDLDGDGQYELIFEWEPTTHPENAYLEAIDLKGNSLWRISCGPNTTYNSIAFMVYDLDGDGKAEIACKTGPGTKDGLGNYLSKGPAATDDDAMIIPRISGHLMEDPSYMTVFNGQTGAEMATVNYPISIGLREDHEATWEDNYGKRAQSIKSAVLYDKDKGPLLVFCRGIYSRIAMGAYTWDGNNLKQEWEFDSDKLAEPERTLYRGEGNHGVTVADVDGDGSDELMYGACAIDNDGKGLYATGRGHGDAHAVGDLDPDRPGMEYFQPHENATYGVSFRDAATGEIIWEILSPADVGRAWAADITADNPGFEISVVGDYIDNGKDDQSSVFDVKGNPLTYNYNSYYQPVYFDGDIQRELRNNTGIDDVNNGGRLLTAWYYGASTIHSTKQDANLVADILGDWREELVFVKSDNSAFVLFSSWIPTEHKVYALMHDPAYRMQVATQNIGYNQPANLSYYLPNGSPKPDIRIIDNMPPAVFAVNRPATANALTNATTVTYNVTFSKNVTGVDYNAFTLTATGNTAGTISSVISESPISYQVTVSDISGDGTLRLDVKASGISIVDEANNNLQSGFTSGEIYTFDFTGPAIIAPADITVSADNESCEATNVVLGNPETSDVNHVETPVNDAPNTYPTGTTIVTWTVKDGVGNSNTATQKVIVLDTQKPLVSELSAVSVCYEDNGFYSIPTLNATDNCGIDSISYVITGATSRSGNSNDASGNFNVGVSTITWTVTDIHDNQTAVSNTVAVNAALNATIADVYAINNAHEKNTLYVGYGPSSLTITATPDGGKAPYTYNWSNGQLSQSIIVNSAGTYTVIITDALGCQTSASIDINVINVQCGNSGNKVMVCHNGQEICVSSNAVQAHLNHGCKLGSCSVISQEQEPIVEVLAFPNPTTGDFTVQLSGYKSSKATIIITNIIGQLVMQKEVSLKDGKQDVPFNLPNQARGIYLLKVLSADGENNLKVVLE